MHQAPILRRPQAARGLGNLDLRAFLHHDQITFQNNTDGQAHDITMRRGDNRFPIHRLYQQVRRISTKPLGSAQTFKFFTRSELPLQYVSARGKRSTFTRDDGEMRFRFGVKTPQGVVQRNH